jgi:hypothetical protein
MMRALYHTGQCPALGASIASGNNSTNLAEGLILWLADADLDVQYKAIETGEGECRDLAGLEVPVELTVGGR